MIFIINKLKYDTDKMELISDKCQYLYSSATFVGNFSYWGNDVKLWRSKNKRWLLTYLTNHDNCRAVALPSEEAQEYLLRYDVEAYEKAFGELEEA